MKAKKRFYWLGVLDAKNSKPLTLQRCWWATWQRVAYEWGYWSNSPHRIRLDPVPANDLMVNLSKQK